MTAQAADNLINDHPAVDFGGLHLHGIIRGNIHSNNGWGEPYRFTNPADPPKDVPRCSALWRGYVATFRLATDGQLELLEYSYPLSLSKARKQAVKETLTGDFWLVMKHNFFGPRTYVPFRDGRIVEDQSEWRREDRGSSA